MSCPPALFDARSDIPSVAKSELRLPTIASMVSPLASWMLFVLPVYASVMVIVSGLPSSA